MKGIVFFDYDGTLVDESCKIFRPTATTLSSIEKLRENGFSAILSTGRAKCYVPDTGITWDGIVASNGAYAEIDGKTVYSNLVDDALLDELMERADELGYVYVLENQDVCYTNGMKNENFLKMLNRFDINKEHFRPVSEAEKPCANKMFLTYESEEDYGRIKKAFEGKFVLGVHRGSFSCDCDPVGNNKGIGVRRMIEYTGIDPQNTYAFGDGPNDYGLLSSAGHGIAMGVHHESLDSICEKIAPTVAEEGITAALKEYGLI